MRRFVISIGLILPVGCMAGYAVAASPTPSTTPSSRPPAVEAISLLGDTLLRPPLAPETRAEYEQRLNQARAAYRAHPEDPDSIIWLGRRTAYLGLYRASIDIFSKGIAKHPDDPRIYRHRGHRYLTLRNFDDAITDLQQAAAMVAGKPDEVEPDGLPNARNIPTSTLQSNIWYHLGLAHYLRGNFPRALDAYREAMKVSKNPDMLVATSHWLYMTLRRLGREKEAAAVLIPIQRDMEILENRSYHRLLLMYKGELPVDSLLVTPAGESAALDDATVGYGVANWHFYNGRRDEAEKHFLQVLGGSTWPAFGYLAAEAEVARRGRKIR